MTALARTGERAFVDQVREVAGCRGRRCARDGCIVSGAEAAFESFRTFAKHAQQRFLLAGIQLIAQPVELACLFDQKFDVRCGVSLRFESDARKPGEPRGDFVAFIGGFERRIIRFASHQDRRGRVGKSSPRASTAERTRTGHGKPERIRWIYW
jgi:hypothetical protein